MPKAVVLRPPTKAERKKGLPTSKQEAIEAGLTRFMHPDGEERIIRNYGSESAPAGRVTKVSERKRSRGGGTDGSRQINEAFVTPKDADAAAFSKAMADAASEGKEGHHVIPIARTADGARFSEARGGPDITDIQQSYAGVGTPVGNQEENILALAQKPHQNAHREYDLLDAGIAKVGQESDEVFSAFKAKGGTISFKGNAMRNLALIGVAGGLIGAGEAFAAGDTQEGVARLAETAVGEVPVVGDVIQSEPTAGADMSYPARAAQMKAEADAAEKRAADAVAAGPSREFCLKGGNLCFKAPELGLSEWLTGTYGRQEEREALNGSKSS